MSDQPPPPQGPPGQPPPPGYGSPGYGAPGWGPAGSSPPGHSPSPYPYPPQPTRRTNTLAVISFVLGLVGLTGFCLLTGIPALILGYKATAASSGDAAGAEDGEGLATAGIVLGWISTVVSVLIIAFFVAMMAFGIAVSDDLETECNNFDDVTYNDC
ncbi:MAG: DUF4190 domain-containing protein [Acidimicrobiia bacterium]|nr:DUF4190 domain-containing protein [Acidimicrobiia bacterium]